MRKKTREGMRYTNVYTHIWNDEKFKALSDLSQRFFQYLLTCPHGNLIGMFVLKRGYVFEDLGCSPDQYLEWFGDVVSTGAVYYDDKNNIVLLKNHLIYNPITNPNQLKAVKDVLATLPKTDLAGVFRDCVVSAIEEFDKNDVLKELLDHLDGKGEKPVTDETDEYKAFEEFVKAKWNELATNHPAISKILAVSSSRRIKLRARFNEKLFRNFDRIVEKIGQSKFLCMENKRDDKNPHKNWVITFDWLIGNDKDYLKVLEGQYDDKKGKDGAW